MEYTSSYTGAQIDAAIQKVLGLEWKSNVLNSSSGVKGGDGQPGLRWTTSGSNIGLRDYELIVLSGYKEGVPEAGQTTQVILATKSLEDRGGGVQKTVNIPFAARNSDGTAWYTVLFFWIDNGWLHWMTATDYGDAHSKEFVVTRVEGFTL